MKKFIFIKTLGLMPGMAMPREPLSLGGALGLGAANGLVNLGGSFLTSAFNRDAAYEAMRHQVQASKELYAWQQKHYLSPKAQLENVAEAGFMPSSQFGNHSPVNVGGQMVSPTAPTYGVNVGTQSLTDVANLLVGAAQAKKAGVEIPKIEEDTKNQMLNNERQEFENLLLSKYGLQRTAAEVALAAQNVKLAKAQTDLVVQDKAVKEWSATKEKAISEVNQAQRDILRKELANKDIELDIRNRQGEANIGLTKSQANAATASAELARANKHQIETLLPHEETAKILDNGINALNYDIQSLLKVDNISKAHSEAVRLRNMAERGEILGRYVPPKEAMSNHTNYTVYDQFEDALFDLWRTYQRGVKQGIDKSKSK